MVIACVAIHDVKILDLVKVMLCCVCRVDACNTWVETATEDCAETCLLETLAVSPLPRVLEVCFILWFVVGCVEIVAATGKTCVHDCEVLIRQSEVYYDFWLVVAHESLQLLHIVSINLCGREGSLAIWQLLVDILHDVVTLCLCTACDLDFLEDVTIHCHLHDSYGSNATGSDY